MNTKRLIALALVAILLMGGGVYFLLSEQENVQPRATDSEVTQQTSAPVPEEAEETNADKVYTSDELAISFVYPADWLTLTCDGGPETIYMASTEAGLGINEQSGGSILCGGGSDFAPQMVIFERTNADPPAGGPVEVTVSDVDATKYILVSNGEGLRPSGFQTVTYVVPRSDGSELFAVYSQYPDTAEGYDTSEESLKIFETIIEEELELEL